MEIFLEIFAALFGALFELFIDALGQVIFQILAEIGMRSLMEPFRKIKLPNLSNPVLAGIGYSLYGAIAGGLSLLLPKMFVLPEWLRILNIVVTPVVCGFTMVMIGQFRQRRGERVIRIDTFLYGYLFALAMAFVRFAWR
ncbi:MAG: hypothetical protein ACYC6Z_06405 [Thermoleophilia bacterium]